MSRSVSYTHRCTSSRMPYGTECLVQNIACRIVVTIHDQTTGRTHVGTHAQSLFDERATSTAILAGVVGCNFEHRNSMQRSVVLHPSQETAPGCITDRFCEVVIAHKVGDLQVFKGDQVVRRDKRIRLFAGEIFTLPLDFEMCFCQSLAGFLAVLGTFLLGHQIIW